MILVIQLEAATLAEDVPDALGWARESFGRWWHPFTMGAGTVELEAGTDLRPRRPEASEEAEADQKRVAAIQAGDRNALRALYDRHAPAMLGVACRILGSRGDAEDLVHDVFLEAWNKAASYDPARASVRSWLMLRLRSRGIDRLRSVAVGRTRSMVPERDEPVADENPSRRLEGRRARQALGTLSKEQRSVVELAYFGGLTCREIALRCEIPVGTVKSRLSAALAKLRVALGAGAN